MHAFYPDILETKFTTLDVIDATEDGAVEGYAAIFGEPDRGGDIIARGAFAAALSGRRSSVKFLWQHDAGAPIGVWDDIREDARGLRVRGRLLGDVQRATEARALLRAGALDGLSIGFRTVRAQRREPHRVLTEIELWEISLVTFPMAESARLSPGARPVDSDVASAIRDAASAFAV